MRRTRGSAYMHCWPVCPTIVGLFDTMSIRCRSNSETTIRKAPSIVDRLSCSASELTLNLVLARHTWEVVNQQKTSFCCARVHLTRVGGPCFGFPVISLVKLVFATRCSSVCSVEYNVFAFTTWSITRSGSSLSRFSFILTGSGELQQRVGRFVLHSSTMDDFEVKFR